MIIIIKMNLCIYRNCNSCISCDNYVYNNMKFCYSHTFYKNYLYEIIDYAIHRREIKTNNDIYDIYKFIYDNSSIFTKEYIFKGCLKILFSKKEYLLNYYNLQLNDNNDDKNKLIDIIFKLNKNTYEIEKNNYNKYLIIYRFFMKKIIKKYYYNDNIKLNNIEDPFTLENVNDLDKKDLFIYNENRDNTYFFIANELKYFIETNGKWNPYTIQEIPNNIIRNLNYFIKINKLNKNKNNLNKYEWTSIPQAYTDVSKIMEKIGFYNDVKWFLKFTSNQIKNIIKTYKIITRECENNNFFNNINDNTIFYDFAREIIKLFENGNDNFNLCCYFIKAISLYSDDFFNNIPEWMGDIETNNIITIPINNLFSNIDILYFINIINERQ